MTSNGNNDGEEMRRELHVELETWREFRRSYCDPCVKKFNRECVQAEQIDPFQRRTGLLGCRAYKRGW